MPTYLFKNNVTGEIFEKFMGISESEEYLKENPDIEKLPQAPYFGGVQDLKHKHVDDGWKETLSKIKESPVVGRRNSIDKWL